MMKYHISNTNNPVDFPKVKAYTPKQHYIDQQMFQVAPLTLKEANYADGFDMKIHSVFGETNWLRISAAQLRQIEQILLSGE